MKNLNQMKKDFLYILKVVQESICLDQNSFLASPYIQELQSRTHLQEHLLRHLVPTVEEESLQ